MLRKLLLLAPLLPMLGAAPALAQMESREGIALQNQILQLRQEMEALRRGGGGGYAAPVPGGGGGALDAGRLGSRHGVSPHPVV
ncbi:hypothetical protein ACVMLK_20505, partial [Teichococcus aerofrigidensis]